MSGNALATSDTYLLNDFISYSLEISRVFVIIKKYIRGITKHSRENFVVGLGGIVFEIFVAPLIVFLFGDLGLLYFGRYLLPYLKHIYKEAWFFRLGLSRRRQSSSAIWLISTRRYLTIKKKMYIRLM